jgi:hypothetical protein
MIREEMIKEYFTTIAPYLNLKYKCKQVKPNVKIIGKRAGYKYKLSERFPFNNSTMALCIPQPGHSIPVIALYGQVSRWFSSQ